MKNSHTTMLFKRILFIFILIFSASFSVAGFSKTSNGKQKSLNFSLIPMHYGLLNAEPHTWNEAKGLTQFEVASAASAGDSQIRLSTNQELHQSELFVYRSTQGNYFVNQVKTMQENIYYLEKPLEENLSKGANLWNFYDNGSHPNTAGYKAIADFSLQELSSIELSGKKHVFIGDSWFNDGTIINRLSSQIEVQSAINKAVHGRTSTQTLSAFDTDFSTEVTSNPDFVWISLGTNDYWHEPTPLSTAEFIQNIEQLIIKINALGAKAIVIDSSVGIYDYNADEPVFSFRKKLSDSYADALQNLYLNSISGSKSSSKGGGISIIFIFFLSLLLLSSLLRKRRV